MANYQEILSKVQEQRTEVKSGIKQLQDIAKKSRKQTQSLSYRQRLMKDPRFRVAEATRKRKLAKEIKSETQRLQEAQQELKDYQREVKKYQARGYDVESADDGYQFTKTIPTKTTTTYERPQLRDLIEMPTQPKAGVVKQIKPTTTVKEVKTEVKTVTTKPTVVSALERIKSIKQQAIEKAKTKDVSPKTSTIIDVIKEKVSTKQPITTKDLIQGVIEARKEAVAKSKAIKTSTVSTEPTKVEIKAKTEVLTPVVSKASSPQSALETLLISKGGAAAKMGEILYEKRTGQKITVSEEVEKPVLTEAKISAMPPALKKVLLSQNKVAGIKREDFIKLPETQQMKAITTYITSGGKKTLEVKKVPYDFVGPIASNVIREEAPIKKLDISEVLKSARDKTDNPLLKRNLSASIDKIEKIKSEKSAIDEIIENLPDRSETISTAKSLLQEQGYTEDKIQQYSKEGVVIAGKKLGVGAKTYDELVEDVTDYIRSSDYIAKQRAEVRKEYKNTGEVPVDIQSQMVIPENIKNAGLEDEYIKKTYEFHIGQNSKDAEESLKNLTMEAYKITNKVPDYIKEQVEVPQSIKDVGLTNEFYDISYRLSLGDITQEQAQEQLSGLTQEKLESLPEQQAVNWMKSYGKFGENGDKTWSEIKAEEPAIELVRDEQGFKTELDTKKWAEEQWKELEGQPLAQAGKAFSASVLGGFANPDFWAGIGKGIWETATTGKTHKDYATEAITNWEYGAQKKIHSGDYLGYIGNDVLLSTPVTNVILPLAGGVVVGKVMSVLPSTASKAASIGAAKLAAGKVVTGKLLTGAAEILPHTPWIFGASASAGVGADLGGTLALEHAGKVEEGTTLSKAIGYGMQLGGMAVGGYYASDVKTPQIIKKVPTTLKAGALRVKTAAYQKVPQLEKTVATVKSKLKLPQKVSYYTPSSTGKIEYFDISAGKVTTPKGRSVSIEEITRRPISYYKSSGGSLDVPEIVKYYIGRRMVTTPYEPGYLGRLARSRGLVKTTVKEVKPSKKLTITEETGMGYGKGTVKEAQPKYATAEELGMPTTTYAAAESILYKPALTGKIVKTTKGFTYTTKTPKTAKKIITTEQLVKESRLRALGEKPVSEYALPETTMYKLAASTEVKAISPTKTKAIESLLKSRDIATRYSPMRKYGLPETTYEASPALAKQLTARQLAKRWELQEIFRSGRRYVYEPMEKYGIPATTEEMALIEKPIPRTQLQRLRYEYAKAQLPKGQKTLLETYESPTKAIKATEIRGRVLAEESRITALKGETPKVTTTEAVIESRPKVGWKEYLKYKKLGLPGEPGEGIIRLEVPKGTKQVISYWKHGTPHKPISYKFKTSEVTSKAKSTGAGPTKTLLVEKSVSIKTKPIKTPKVKEKTVKTKVISKEGFEGTAQKRQIKLEELEALEAGTGYVHPRWEQPGGVGGRLVGLKQRISLAGKQPVTGTGVLPTTQVGMASAIKVGQVPATVQREKMLQAQVQTQIQIPEWMQSQSPSEIQYQASEQSQQSLQEQQQLQKQALLLRQQSLYKTRQKVKEELPPPEEPAPVELPTPRTTRVTPSVTTYYPLPEEKKEEKKKSAKRPKKKIKKFGYKERVYEVPDPWKVVAGKTRRKPLRQQVAKKPNFFSIVK